MPLHKHGLAQAVSPPAVCLLIAIAFGFRTCCGGERLLVLPGIGVVHVPSSLAAARQFSLAIPITLALYLATYAVAACFLSQRPLLALAICLCAVPLALRGLPNKFIAAGLLPSPVFANQSSALRFATELRLQRDRDGLGATLAKPLSGRIDAAVARHAASWVHEQRESWSLHLYGMGAPHMQLGFRYSSGWQGGRVVDAEMAVAPETDREAWSELGEMFEALRRHVEAATGMPTRLHKQLNPPAFLINEPFAMFRGGVQSPEVHHDALIARWPILDGVLQPEASSCKPREQLTLTLTLQTGQRDKNATGIELWRYSEDKKACPPLGHADTSCIVHEFHPYEEGGFVLFPSLQRHATGHGYQPLLGTVARIIMVAFALPCGHGENRVLHLLPTVPARRL